MLLCLLSTGLRRDRMEIQQLEGITLNVFHQSHTMQSRWWDPDACFPDLPRRDICQSRWGPEPFPVLHQGVGAYPELDEDEGQGGISLCQERTQAWNWSWGNSCRIQPCGSGSEVGQDARLPTSPEANPAVVPDGCLAAQTSQGLLQSCWESHPLPCVWAASWLSGVLGLPLTCFQWRCWQVWKFHMEHLWWPWSPPSPHKTLPHSWSIFSARWDAGSLTQGVFKTLHIWKKCSRLFVCFFNMSHSSKQGWHKCWLESHYCHKGARSSPYLRRSWNLLPPPKSDSESFLLLNVSRNSLHPTADSLGYSHTEISAHWGRLCAQILQSYRVTRSHRSGKSSL